MPQSLNLCSINLRHFEQAYGRPGILHLAVEVGAKRLDDDLVILLQLEECSYRVWALDDVRRVPVAWTRIWPISRSASQGNTLGCDDGYQCALMRNSREFETSGTYDS